MTYYCVGACALLMSIIGTVSLAGASEETDATALDRSTTAVTSCSFGEMLSASKGIPTVSGSEATAICDNITRSIGHSPPINVLRAAFKVTSLMSIRGAKAAKPEIAYQLMSIVEVRGITAPDRIVRTFNTVWKIFEGTGGHVTPRDLSIVLRRSGRTARTLSDDGLISIGTLILEQKKAIGE